ncbi:flagellar basal body P-ring formation chaperone FlgA [Thiogranum longum]|jgi:flagella basal body P-ring formation protein FlgA
MIQNSKFGIFFIMLAVLAWHPTETLAGEAATQWQAHAAIRGTAQSFLDAFASSQHEGRTEVRLGQLDPRLRLKSCSQPLEGFMPPGGRVIGNTTVGVRCSDEGGWNIYVSARINVFGPVLITRQPIARGSSIQDRDLELVERNLANLPYGYYTDSQPVTEMLAKRTIAAATVITPQMLQAPKLVKRGERVTVIAESGPLQVRSTGKALNDGKSGDSVRIQAEGSKRVVDGIVVSQGVVKVTL